MSHEQESPSPGDDPVGRGPAESFPVEDVAPEELSGDGVLRERRAPKPQRSSLTRIVWREWLRPFLIILAVMSTFRSAIADWNHVPTGSMEPTILIGDRIFVNKVAYDLRVPFTRRRIATWSSPKRGDLIVFKSPADGKRLVKRVVGEPGDEIELRRNRLIINGETADYDPLDESVSDQLDQTQQDLHAFAKETAAESPSHPIMTTPWRPSRDSFGPVVVPDGHYFVMGDNRDESFDSRWFGFVDGNLIFGRATGVALSVDPDRSYKPRWDRFLHGLR